MNSLPSRYDLKVDETGCEAVGYGENIIREIFDQQIRDRICPIDYVKYFEACPYIIKTPERIFTSPLTLFTVKQQGTETKICSYIWIDDQRIPEFYIIGNVIR
jgi:hypothetical protein